MVSRSLVLTALSLFLALAGGAPVARGQAANELFEEATRRVAESDYGAAITQFKELLDRFPTSPVALDARVQLGMAQFYKGDFDDAIKTMDELVNNPAMPPPVRESASLTKAQALAGKAARELDAKKRTELYVQSAAAFGAFLKEFPQSEALEDALYGRGFANLASDKFGEARKDLEATLTKFPTSIGRFETRYLLGVALLQEAVALQGKGDTLNSEPLLERARAEFIQVTQAEGREPSLANDARLQLGEVAVAQKKFEDALSFYTAVRPRDAVAADLQRRIDGIKAQQRSEPGRFRALQREKQREETKLVLLKTRADPALAALIRVAFLNIQFGKFDASRALSNHLARFSDEDQARTLAFQRTLSFAMQGLMEEAEAAYKALQEKYGADPVAENLGYVMGQQYLAQGKPQKALECFEKALKDYPKGRFTQDIMSLSGTALRLLGRLDEARKRLEDYLRANRGTREAEIAKLSLGMLQVDLGQTDKAQGTFRELSREAKTPIIREEAAFRAGYVFERGGRKDKAVSAYEEFAKREPGSSFAPLALIQVGDIMLADGKKDEAIAKYKEAISKYPESPKAPFAQRAIALAYYRATPPDPESAIQAFDVLLKNYPKSEIVEEALIFQASILAQTKQKAEAKRKFEEIIQQFRGTPTAADAQYGLAKLSFDELKGMGNYAAFSEEEKASWDALFKETSSAAEALLTEYPSAPIVARGLDMLLELQQTRQRYEIQTAEQTEAYFQSLARRFDSNPPLAAKIRFALAGALAASGNTARALEIMRGAYSPNLSLSAGNLDRFGQVLLDSQQFEEALAVYQRLGRENPRDQHAQAHSVYGMGMAYMGLAKGGEAADMFAKLKKDYPWSDRIQTVNFNLAATIRKKDPDQAIELFNEVMRAQRSAPELKAASMWMAGEILEEKAARASGSEANDLFVNAAAYYEQIDTWFGAGEPERSPEGLWRAGQLYEKAKRPQDARRAYEGLVQGYPEYAKSGEAKDRLRTLPPPPKDTAKS